MAIPLATGAMSKGGNFEGHNILNIAEAEHEDEALTDETHDRLKELKRKLRIHSLPLS